MSLKKKSTGWWKGESKGNIGLFPCSSVEDIVETEQSHTIAIPVVEKPQTISKCKVRFDYEVQQQTDLALIAGQIVNILEKAESGWWKGECNGKIGLFPSNFVEDIVETEQSHTIAIQSPIIPNPVVENPQATSNCRVLYNYEAEQPTDLTLVGGQIVNILEKDESGWWKGECNGKIGLFPSNFVQEM